MFSVVILHHNKAAYSRACLQSLLRTSARPLQVLNVDNGSRDETPSVLDEFERDAQTRGIECERLRFEENIGAVKGRNEALKRSHGDYLALLDNDTLIAQTDWLQQLRAFLDEDEARGVVAPKLLFPWAPFDIECCGCAITASGRVVYTSRGEKRESLRVPFEIPCAISAAWLMTRRVWEECGPLDEIYSPVQYEDLDFCFRVRQAKHEVWAFPGVELYHWEHTTTAGSSDINFRYVTAKNALTFKKRWSQTFAHNAAPEEAARWRDLPKSAIEDVDWGALLESES